jgi:hypothetical protein
MMHMARKASQFVNGSSKVDGAVRNGSARAVFHAIDAAADGVRKIVPGAKGLACSATEDRKGDSRRSAVVDGGGNGRADGPERFYPCGSACRAGG